MAVPGTGGDAAAEGAFLRIERLTKRFDTMAAVDAVSIDIAKGEIFALLGSSGCGKSTLLRMLAGFETPTEGSIVLEGEDISRLPPYVRPINMMFQSYALFPHLTVAKNVAFGLERQGLPKAKIAERVDAMLTLVQLKPYVGRKPHQLSGGQQQRVALARSLALEPKLLLLDEPLGALDRKLREQTQFELKNIIKRVGVTCVMVTHDQEEAMTMADRIAVMSAGRFLQVGQPEDIYETPSNRFVADFIGNVNLFDGTLEEDHPDHCTIASPHGQFYVGHGVTGVPGMKVSVAVRPEKIELEARKGAVLAPHNALAGTVVERAYFGSSSLYRVLLASGMKLQVSVANASRHGDQLEPGAQVVATVAPDAIVVLTQ
ncbi:MAG: polyamine ABC transporter ATP-binding protein [Burkholderiales bacterium]|nr:polyamine ABC transporter ATP-binding protein [Burkholderiales bacterium]MDE2394762.1 polyamine ABC transporter ATP-binding protein [Burkholderiales bacterium]MDE2456590.1 polyamine ABC transporter ATP-binding protein [Burkholderiales bacterium]